MNIGFIGIGVMGESMVRHLMAAGHRVTVYNRTAAKADALLQEGALWAESAGACAEGQDAVIPKSRSFMHLDIVFTMVGFPKDVEQVYLSEDGILAHARSGAYVIDMTTTSPALWQRIAAAAREKGLHPLDAPVSGGDSGARNATLSIMAGGELADFEACLPLFQQMGKNIVHTGGDGSGQHTKMANQIAIAGAIAGVAEAIRYGEACGLDTENMLRCISAGAAGSWQLSNNGPKMLARDWAPGFYIKHFIKDMAIARDESAARALPLPVLTEVLSMYESLQEDGHCDEGTQSLYTWYQG